MPVKKTFSVEELQKKADDLHTAILEFEKVLDEVVKKEINIRQEVLKKIDKKKIHNILNRIVDIK